MRSFINIQLESVNPDTHKMKILDILQASSIISTTIFCFLLLLYLKTFINMASEISILPLVLFSFGNIIKEILNLIKYRERISKGKSIQILLDQTAILFSMVL